MEECLKKGLLRSHSFTDETIRRELENAARHLENAERNFEYGMLDVAIVSSYTSMFHAVRSLLFMNGYKERSHICLASFLKEMYPEFREYAEVFDIYRVNRHESLYGIEYEPKVEDARTGIEKAKEILASVKRIVEE